MLPTAAEAAADEGRRRILDLVVAIFGLVVFSPLLLLIALLIKLESPGPVLFRQKRVGKDERLFEILKFRSMTLPPAGEQTVAPVADMVSFQFQPFGYRTVIGRALRACSLDELPNLLNVLRGDLHLVGPRPDEIELVEQYRAEWRRRHTVKPGITGLAQIHGRNDLTYGEMMAYDLDYVDYHPFSRDVRIILNTLGVVLRRDGVR